MRRQVHLPDNAPAAHHLAGPGGIRRRRTRSYRPEEGCTGQGHGSESGSVSAVKPDRRVLMTLSHLAVMQSVLKRIIGHVEEAQRELTEWQVSPF